MIRHPVPEAFHGAGGIAYHDGRFVIVGGLPEGIAHADPQEGLVVESGTR